MMPDTKPKIVTKIDAGTSKRLRHIAARPWTNGRISRDKLMICTECGEEFKFPTDGDVFRSQPLCREHLCPPLTDEDIREFLARHESPLAAIQGSTSDDRIGSTTVGKAATEFLRSKGKLNREYQRMAGRTKKNNFKKINKVIDE